MGFSGGYDGDTGGAKAEVIARVAEIKAAPHHGQKRLVVREYGKSKSHTVIDIDMSQAKDIEEKGTYRFQVEEKNAGRPGQSQMARQSGFKNYYCEDAPEKFEGMRTEMNRFSEGGHFKNTSGKRTKF